MNGMGLRKMREKLGLTQTALAEKLGVSQVTISRWETDAMVIRHPKILRLALEQLRVRKAG